MSAVLGIDTSNYTTSVAIYDTENHTVNNVGKLLSVKSGEKGLRQSDAVFQHTKALPSILKEALVGYEGKISAVGVSNTPRDEEGSYMPCFLSGATVASGISSAIGCPIHNFSHQRGHILAALYSQDSLHYIKDKFYAFHVSGGTTELLLVKPHRDRIIECEIVANTLDLNAGQVIDRVGIMLGLDFPAGIALDNLSLEGVSPKKIKITLKDGNCCLSGVENKCKELLLSGESHNNIARFAIEYILETIKAMTLSAFSKHGEFPVVYAGGVMSNSIISSEIPKSIDCIFAKPQFSRDNAAGIAVLTAIKEGYISI